MMRGDGAVARALDFCRVGPCSRSNASSASMAFSSCSGFTPGRAVASIWNTDPSIWEELYAVTSCAICCS